MRVLAISGSLRASSSNTALVRAMGRLVPEGIEFRVYEGLGEVPHFTPDLDGEVAPQAVAELRRELQEADGVLICTPEYAFGVPGVLKNALDWTVSSGDLWGKPVAVISASPLLTGGDKAHASLLLTLKALGARVPEGGTMMIGMMRKKMGEDGEVTDEETREGLKRVLEALEREIREYVV